MTKSYLTLSDPMDLGLQGFSVHRISQARILSRLPFPSPGDLLNPGIKPLSPALQADFFYHWVAKEAHIDNYVILFVGTSPVAQTVKASDYNVGDLGSISELGRSPGEGNGSPFQYSCLENSMDRGAWQAIVHAVAKSQTRLATSLHFTFTL